MKKYIIVLIAVFAVLLVGCAQVEDTDVKDDGDAMEGDAMEDADDTAMEDDNTATAKITGAVVLSATELLTDLSCDDNRVITLTFTNTGDEAVTVSDAEFIVNGQLDASPECDAAELKVGESTVCSGLKALGVGKTSVVQVLMPDRAQGLQKVDCE